MQLSKQPQRRQGSAPNRAVPPKIDLLLHQREYDCEPAGMAPLPKLRRGPESTESFPTSAPKNDLLAMMPASKMHIFRERSEAGSWEIQVIERRCRRCTILRLR